MVSLSINNPCASPVIVGFDPCLDTSLLKNLGFQNLAKVGIKLCSVSIGIIMHFPYKVTLPEGEYQVSAIDDALYDDSFQEQESQIDTGNPE